MESLIGVDSGENRSADSCPEWPRFFDNATDLEQVCKVLTNVTENDLAATNVNGDLSDWPKVLFKLLDHYTSRTTQSPGTILGRAATEFGRCSERIALTSARPPLVDLAGTPDRGPSQWHSLISWMPASRA